MMELSHHTSDLDPSSVLGFGSALALLNAPEEVARLLTGALRSMGLADLQAVVLDDAVEGGPRVLGSAGVRSLPEPVADELQQWTTDASGQAGEDAAPPSHRQLDVPEESAVAEQGIDRLVVTRLGTLERDFGVAVAGLDAGTTHTSLQVSSLQMLAAQASMALHRIELDREQAAQETALRESEARYRELYENGPVASLSVTAEGEIRMANRRATELFDVSEATLVGRSILDFCAGPLGGQEAAQRLAQCLRDGEPVRDDEVALCPPDGDQLWVRLTMRPVEGDDAPRERLVMMVDVTERRRMDAALRDARDELEDRVAARTAELRKANDRLSQHTRRLEALHEIDQAILAAESPREIATETLRCACQLIPFHRASVSVLDHDAGVARVLATRQEDTLLDRGTTIPLDDFHLPEGVRAGEAVVIPDLSARTHSPIAAQVRAAGVHSVLCLPMLADGTLYGLLQIGRTHPDAFSEEDRAVGTQLADHLVIALRQSRLLRTVQAQRERLEARVQARTRELKEANDALTEEVDERKQAERALRRSRERLTRIIDSAIDAIISIDPSLNIHLFNTAAEEIFRCSAPDATCTSLDAFLSEPFEALVRRHIEAHQAAQRAGDGAAPNGHYLSAPDGLRARRADGTFFPVEATLCPIQLPGRPRYLIILRDMDELVQAEEEVAQLESERSYLQEELKNEYNFDEIVGTSPPMQAVFDAIDRVAATETTVLVCGETGTGKELVARALHDRSARADQVLVKVNCAALSNDLIESELFGHEKGAFTGATEQREGRFELADGGTLFLDEVGELPLDTQAKLLRVLQHQTFERVGGSRTLEVDTRILAATNRDLEAAVEAGAFRSDLYYRLHIFPIEVPPLRERTGDIPRLAEHFCEMYASRTGTTVEGLTPEALTVLRRYDWPGNVRELANIIERAILLTRDGVLRPKHLSIREAVENERPASFPTLEAVQRRHIERALERTGGVVGGDAGAAQLLDLKRTTLLSRMDRLGIDADAFRS